MSSSRPSSNINNDEDEGKEEDNNSSKISVKGRRDDGAMATTISSSSNSSDGDSDEFSDVVMLDPLGREEERAIKQKQQPNTSQKEEVGHSSEHKSPQKQQISSNQQQHQEIQQQQPQIPEMDPSPVYPNLHQSVHQQQGNANTQQQSWFSSNQLPSFLASNNDGEGDGSQTTASASLFRLCGELRARLQPWGVFFRPAKFGLPPGLVSVGPRIKHNLGHFLSNYLCLFVVLLIYCILTSLLMLLTLIVLAGLCYTIYQRTQKGPIILGGQEIPASLLYTLALMICIPLFYMANAGSVMYWVIGTGLFLMLAHAIFYASEELPGQEFEVVSVVTA